MLFSKTPLDRVLLAHSEPRRDERGFFARLWCRDELAVAGLNVELAQCSVSSNRLRGTVRGMHWQAQPHPEAKLVGCVRGAVHDVALDLRPESPSFGRWFGAELSADNRAMLYIPEGCAHGFQTLADDTEVVYFISTRYRPELARGVRWDDPAFAISWPLPVTMISQRDADLPFWSEVI